MRILTLCVSLMSTCLVSSCQQDTPKPASTELSATRWMLTEVEAVPISLSSYSDTYRSYIQFDAGSRATAGLAPCNSFSGTFTQGATAGQLTISQQGSTRTTCPAQTIEDNYLAALPKTVRYEISGRELRLYDATNSTKPLLLFTAAE
ncbi:META domain-containing protein [Hymenobacter perfusus]|nr:META domain-containing protein [Hymenobacter perfusus]